jgi:hypothetical protein
MSEPKIYCGRGKLLKGKDGWKDRIKLSFGETDRALLEKHKSERGWTNLVVCEAKQADKYGNTHYGVIDTWRPAQAEGTNTATPKTDVSTGEPVKDQDEPMPF